MLSKKSFLADVRNFLAPLVRPARGNVRDHIESHKAIADLRTCPTVACGGGDNKKLIFARFSEPLRFGLFYSIEPTATLHTRTTQRSSVAARRAYAAPSIETIMVPSGACYGPIKARRVQQRVF